jgi:hypothetical protein
MTAKKTVAESETPKDEYQVALNFTWRDPATQTDTHFFAGTPFPSDGPELEKHLDWGYVVPASAGSGQPGSTDEGATE